MKRTSTFIAAILFTLTAASQDLNVDGRAIINNTSGSGVALEVFTPNTHVAKFSSSTNIETILEIENTSINGDKWSLIVDSNGRFHLDESGVARRITLEAGGHIGINQQNPTVALDVVGQINATGSINPSSDVNLKELFSSINTKDVLKRIIELPISEWQYKASPDRHIGPMAQDFYAAFGLGQGETTIATVDADGVALAAIKALAEENEFLKITTKELKLENKDLQKRNTEIELRLAKIEAFLIEKE